MKFKAAALIATLNHVEGAVFLVGPGGAIAFANDSARALLGKGIPVREKSGALHAAAADTDRILHDIFASADRRDASAGARGVAVPLVDAGQERWFAHVLPVTSGRRCEAGRAAHALVAVFIRRTAPNAPPPLEALARLYNLTAGEMRVLDAVLRERGVKAMAEALGLSQGTVKTHLHHVFRKTGTARQSDLVKLVAGL